MEAPPLVNRPQATPSTREEAPQPIAIKGLHSLPKRQLLWEIREKKDALLSRFPGAACKPTTRSPPPTAPGPAPFMRLRTPAPPGLTAPNSRGRRSAHASRAKTTKEDEPWHLIRSAGILSTSTRGPPDFEGPTSVGHDHLEPGNPRENLESGSTWAARGRTPDGSATARIPASHQKKSEAIGPAPFPRCRGALVESQPSGDALRASLR